MLTRRQIIKLQRNLPVADPAVVAVCRALSDQRRCRILQVLLRQKMLCVTEVAAIFKISVPAASQQLRILERAGLVKAERMGQIVCYEMARSHVAVRAMIKLLKV